MAALQPGNIAKKRRPSGNPESRQESEEPEANRHEPIGSHESPSPGLCR